MNVFLGDIQKPNAQTATVDVINILGEEVVSPAIAEGGGTEFVIAFANVTEPEAAPKQGNIVAKSSVNTGAQLDDGNFATDVNQLAPSSLLTVSNNVKLSPKKTEVELGAIRVPALQLTSIQPILTHSQIGQTVTQKQDGQTKPTPSITLPIINSDLIKTLPPVLGTTLILVPNKDVSKTGDAALLDIDIIPKKMMPVRSSNVTQSPAHTHVQAPVLPQPLVPEIQPENARMISQMTATLPTYSWAKTGVNFTPIASQELLAVPALPHGEADTLLSQIKSPIQMPTQISSQIAFQAASQTHTQAQAQVQSVVMQVREPMVEQLGVAREALQDKTVNKPKDIVVQLSPAELGRVQIRFSFDTGERIGAQIFAENPETLAVLRQKSGLLSTQLKLGGFDSVDLSFDASGQKNFTGQNSGAEFSKSYNGQAHPNIWQAAEADIEKKPQPLGMDDEAYPMRARIGFQSAQIDIII